MPPKRSVPLPLDGCSIALSGTFPGLSQTAIERELLTPLGASLAKTLNTSTTHLITTHTDYNKPSAKVKQAQSGDVHIVQLSWLEDCLAEKKKLSEGNYAFSSPPTSLSSSAADGKTNGSRKRKTHAVSRNYAEKSDEDDESEPEPQPRKKSKASITNDSQNQTQVKSDSKANGQATSDGRTNIATSNDIHITLDEHCPLAHHQIYVDDTGVIYDASLNQTNAGQNNNKFYRLQLIHENGDYRTWSRWGRVGERGQSKMLGNGDLASARREFESKFKSKSGLSWDDRGAKAKFGKYTFIERSYANDSDDEKDGSPDVKTEDAGSLYQVPESKLDPSIQELLELIFNQQYFATAMTSLNYDANKLPLGKLSKNTITRGYQALKDLSALLNNQSFAQSEYGTNFQTACENLSNAFYSVIPHAFGRNRPPIINNDQQLLKEVELLDSLSDMKEAANIMKKEPKDIEATNALDRQFKGLNLEEMTPLKYGSEEFAELKNYLVNTTGATHNANYQVRQIFRIQRQGEKERFDASEFCGPPRDRRLLWHGSRCTNFGGILSQGLRIAPPEAPVSGYMFGKGIYLADMSSKSANYCCPYISNGHALLLLCEAELGDPMQVLTNASYNAGEDAKAKGLSSTWGQGSTGPSLWKDAECVHPSLKGVKMPDTTVKPGPTNVQGAYLQYNEYITYDIAQVRLRYLFQVKM